MDQKSISFTTFDTVRTVSVETPRMFIGSIALRGLDPPTGPETFTSGPTRPTRKFHEYLGPPDWPENFRKNWTCPDSKTWSTSGPNTFKIKWASFAETSEIMSENQNNYGKKHVTRSGPAGGPACRNL